MPLLIARSTKTKNKKNASQSITSPSVGLLSILHEAAIKPKHKQIACSKYTAGLENHLRRNNNGHVHYWWSVTEGTRSQAVARIADRTASQQTLVISDCC